MSASAPAGGTPAPEPIRRVTVADIAQMYADGLRIAMLTAYDYPTARLLDEAGIPAILVGDSLGQVLLGYESTVRVNMEEMLHHTKAVVRGTRRALVVADMPFLTYGVSIERSVENAGVFLRETGCQAVKVEGGVRSARTIEAMTRAGIAVMGHIGLTPQSIHQIGRFRVQGKTREAARQLIADAIAVQEAGAFSVVLELVPEQLAAALTERLGIPTIGIGAGPGCSGQIQVVNDVLGTLPGRVPRHARKYANLGEVVLDAVSRYMGDVQAGAFPGPDETVRMDDTVLEAVLGRTPLDRAEAETARLADGLPLDRDL
jgi:3-methyl-2-oxobutanoate hydroxymethyltransferase